MSLPDDLHEPRHDADRLDNLVLTALGESVDSGFAAHLVTCDECRTELDALTRTAQLAREAPRQVAGTGSSPDPSVWEGIAAELGLETGSDVPAAASIPRPAMTSTSSTLPTARWGRRTRAWALAAAAVVVVAAGGVGYAIGHDSTPGPGAAVATAALAAMPGGPAHVSGSAQIHDTGHGMELTVTAQGLPARNGYYEVWLFDPGINQMVAVGTLATNGAGTFPIPPGLTPSAYHVVDVSAQKFDGDPVHQQSVLRGPLLP